MPQFIPRPIPVTACLYDGSRHSVSELEFSAPRGFHFEHTEDTLIISDRVGDTLLQVDPGNHLVQIGSTFAKVEPAEFATLFGPRE